MKSDKFALQRLELDDVISLNVGATTIGRNKAADIITASDICSRQHCVITLNPDGTIYITNQVKMIISILMSYFFFKILLLQSKLNGTYVNNIKIDERCKLKLNDVIGIGCDEAALRDRPVPLEQMFVFRLIKKTDTSIVVSDDEDKDIKPVIITNGITERESPNRENVANQSFKNPSPAQNNGMFVLCYFGSFDFLFNLKKM